MLCPPTDLIIVRNSTPLLSWAPAHLLMFAPMGQLMLIAAAAKAILPWSPSTHYGLAEQLHMLKHCWGELERRVPLIFVQYGNGQSGRERGRRTFSIAYPQRKLQTEMPYHDSPS